ncbi:hypothetical protein [Desulfuromonas thiophila]|uniref:hypothetical protein n=1 Tax=Desulfuromonas thiophila TaxID=57664 RepID=UPI0024A8DE3D|nr:hypothetical protein [Desulfuromonas thiophila]
MGKLSEIKIGILKKITSLPYFLFLLSLALFSDTYILAVYGETIRTIDSKWLSLHVNPSEIAAFIGAFGFFYAAFVPGTLFLTSLITVFIKKTEYPTFKEGWVHVDMLRKYTVARDNQVAYSEYLRLQKRIAELKHVDVLCFSLVFLSVAGYFLSPNELKGLFQFLYYGIEKFPWYLMIPLKIATVPFMLFVLMVAFRASKEYDQYEYLPDLRDEIQPKRAQQKRAADCLHAARSGNS